MTTDLTAPLAALRAAREEARQRVAELDDQLVDAARVARDGGLSWVQIAEASGLGTTGQAAQVWLARQDSKSAMGTAIQRVRTLTDDGTLSRKDAAARFGVTEVTFAKHLSNPDTEIARRTTVVPPEETGRRVPRYRVADAE